MRNATSSLLSTVLVLGSSALACGGSPASGHSSADEEEAIGVSRAALTTLVVEAESATGAGVIESDPNASNGQVRAFSNVYDAATASFTTNGTVQSGTVRVRTAQCAPQWAQVLVDGVIVLTEMLSTTDAWIDLPLDVQLAEIEFDDETYEPLPVYKPAATRKQIEKALEMLNAAERPLIVAGGGVINADASELLVAFAEAVNVPVVPTLMGWGAIPDDHVLMAGMVGLQTSHRYGNATMLQSDFVLGIGNRWANRHTGSIETYTRGRKFVHVDIEPTQIGRVFNPDLGIVSDAKAALELFVAVAKEWRKAGKLRERQAWPAACLDRKRSMLRRSNFDDVPIKPQRVYAEMNKAFSRDTCFVSVIGLSQIAGAQFLAVYKPRNWINAGQAGPLGWTLPAALGVRAADPDREIVALSGDYDFQFLIEELAVGAQHRLPYIHVVVNNAYLGLIRQAQRGFSMDYEVSLAFENQNRADDPEAGYGVDHVAVAEAMGCKAVRVRRPEEFAGAFKEAKRLMKEHRVPVVLEFILERVTNISMGTEIDKVTEFEELAEKNEDAPTAVVLLD